MTSPNDEYARKYMGGEDVRFLDKVKAPWWLNALVLVPGVAGVIATIATGEPLGAAVVSGVTFVSWALLTALRVTVTNTHLHVQYGLFGPSVPLADIVTVDVVDYDAKGYGGWGLRRGSGGRKAYSLPGRGGKSVKVTTREGKVIEMTSEQPSALAQAIDDARGGRDLAAVRREHLQDALPTETAAPSTAVDVEATPLEIGVDAEDTKSRT